MEEKFLRRTKAIKIKESSKSELIFQLKPKIPAKSKSLYREFYLRSFKKMVLIYHIETNIFVFFGLDEESTKNWIDKNYDEINRRIKLAIGEK